MAWMLLEAIGYKLVEATIGYYLQKGWRELMAKIVKKSTEKCMIQSCTRMAGLHAMGLCVQCYTRAKNKVEAGETTWEALIAHGLCRPKVNPFDDAYSRAMQEDDDAADD